VAGGTGDIAFRIVAASDKQAQGTVLDINGSMLGVGAERAVKKGYAANLDFVEANAEELPFEDATASTPTPSPSAFAMCPTSTRRLGKPTGCLRRGGRFLCLEFSEVEMPLLDKVYDAWSFNGIPAMGKAIAGDAEPYQYLVESIRKFPRQDDFAAMITRAGFSRVGYTNYTGGIAALHSGWKL
jgi:demethylmenaquinone methyltransferase/2-methoxy-6-polyprenyl-1,4-benzoquinol methylase